MGRKKVVGQTNPFEFSPCEFNETIYRCRQPFIQILPGCFEEIWHLDKFAGGKMDPEVLDQMVAESANRYTFIERLFSQRATTEGHFRPQHIEVLGSPGMFVRPTRKEWAAYEKSMADRGIGWTKKDLKNYAKSTVNLSNVTNQGLSLEAPLAVQLADDSDEIVSSSSSSDDGYEPMHEGSAKNEHGLSNAYREDVLLYVSNEVEAKAAAEAKAADESSNPMEGGRSRPTLKLDPKKLTASVECKDDKRCDLLALYQAAGCATPGVLRNVENGHGEPVHLLVLGFTKWLYGVLVVEGIVDVGVQRTSQGRQNEISLKAYNDYVSTTGVTGGKGAYSHAVLNDMLKTGVEVLRGNCSDKTCILPGMKYIVGRLYIPEDESCWLEFPTALKKDRLNRAEPRQLFEGLARTVIGDKVVGWTSEDVQSAKVIRTALGFEADIAAGIKLERCLATDKIITSYLELTSLPAYDTFTKGWLLTNILGQTMGLLEQTMAALPDDRKEALQVRVQALVEAPDKNLMLESSEPPSKKSRIQ